jgi:hypothetical protein
MRVNPRDRDQVAPLRLRCENQSGGTFHNGPLRSAGKRPKSYVRPAGTIERSAPGPHLLRESASQGRSIVAHYEVLEIGLKR